MVPAWSFLRLNVLRWSIVSGLMKNKIPQAAAIIPVAGYAILWSDSFEGLMKFQESLNHYAWFTTQSRLYFIYFGALLLTASLVLHWLRCPKFIRRHPNVEDYIKEQVEAAPEHVTQAISKEVNRMISFSTGGPKFSDECNFVFKKQVSSEIRTGVPFRTNTNSEFQFYYLQHEDMRLWAIILSLLLFTAGSLLILLPSLEVFVLVVRSLISA